MMLVQVQTLSTLARVSMVTLAMLVQEGQQTVRRAHPRRAAYDKSQFSNRDGIHAHTIDYWQHHGQ
jgi:hypothetical protein